MGTQILGPAVQEGVNTGPLGWNDPEEIVNQLERLVGSVHFRNSKRYPALLRYLVEQSLLGKTDCLKERTLGIEVFGRPPAYDTNADPIVRITAGEVRKRIAQYYQSPDHERELRLELPLGSYVPHFLPPHEPAHLDAHHLTHYRIALATEVPLVQEIVEPRQSARPILTAPQEEDAGADVSHLKPSDSANSDGGFQLRSRRIQAAIAVGLLSVVAACAVAASNFVNSRRQDAGFSLFWGPFLQSKEPATIILGVHSFDIHGNDFSPISFAQLPQGEQTALASMIHSNMVPVSDVISYSEVVSLLTRQALAFKTQSAAETTIEEFRRGPLILIGGFDNMWTMRLSSSLRFRFIADSESLHEIRDSQHPETRWQFDNAQSVLANARDYAIVARFFDPQIEQYVMVVAGIGKSGTEAAAEFVTDKRALETWLEAAPAEHLDNVEIVLATDVIEGKHGPPHVITSYRW